MTIFDLEVCLNCYVKHSIMHFPRKLLILDVTHIARHGSFGKLIQNSRTLLMFLIFWF